MQLIKYLIPGQYSDAFVYMGNIFAIDSNNDLVIISTKYLASAHSSRKLEDYPLLEHLITRNGWLTHPACTSLFRTPELNKAILELVSIASKVDAFELKNVDYAKKTIPLDQKINDVLDIRLYFGRLIIGADSGLFGMSFDFQNGEASSDSNWIRRHDARIFKTSAKYGAVQASAGGEGLFTGFGEFFKPWNELGVLKQTADSSVRVSYLESHAMVNYERESKLFLKKAQVDRMVQEFPVAGEGKERSKFVMTSFAKEDISLDNLTVNPKNMLMDHPVWADFAFQLNRRLLVHYSDGTLAFKKLVLHEDPKGKAPVQASQTLKVATENLSTPLSISQWGDWLILELIDKVVMISDGDSAHHLIKDNPVLSVRTYPDSVQYKNLITITDRAGLWLISIFDEDRFAGLAFQDGEYEYSFV